MIFENTNRYSVLINIKSIPVFQIRKLISHTLILFISKHSNKGLFEYLQLHGFSGLSRIMSKGKMSQHTEGTTHNTRNNSYTYTAILKNITLNTAIHFFHLSMKTMFNIWLNILHQIQI